MPAEVKAQQKSMIVAMIISFFLAGLGIAYAGNVGKGVKIFLLALFVFIINIFVFMGILSVVYVIIWIAGLVLTYLEVNEANERKRRILDQYRI
ncbi:hypothetical protein [Methanobrevibacter sp.]|uniref:hypothetical protein n=1 Tax=Methanobrevibacter sp. TaxID=66852 RepID=UPI003890C92C